MSKCLKVLESKTSRILNTAISALLTAYLKYDTSITANRVFLLDPIV